MNWGGLQRYRLSFFRLYDSFFFVAIRVLALLVVLAAVVILAFPFPQALTGVAMIMVAPSLAILAFHLYIAYLRDHPEFLTHLSKNYLLDSFDYVSADALLQLKKKKSWLAFYQTLARSVPLRLVWHRLGLTTLDPILAQFPAPTDEQVEQLASQLRNRETAGRVITVFEVFATLTELEPLKSFLVQQKIHPATVAGLIEAESQRYRHYIHRHFWLPENLVLTGGFARYWATSYTNLLDRFTEELTPAVVTRQALLPLFGRQQAVERIITEMNKTQGQNVLLIGQAGIGKTEVALEIAARLIANKTKTPLDGAICRILGVQDLLSVVSSSEQLEQLFAALFAEISRAGKVLLIVPDFASLINPDNSIGAVNASALLGNYLNHPRIHLIATISSEDYIKLIKGRSSLANSFSSVEITAPEGSDLELVVLTQLPPIEQKHQVFFSLQGVQAVIEYSRRYVKDLNSPERELIILEEVAAANRAAATALGEAEVIKTIEQRAKVPIKVDEEEKAILLNLEDKLHQRIIGQDRAIKLISQALLRARAGLTSGRKPIGSFLFLGPTGVGKTETAKALADIYYGSTTRMIRLDMTEYADDNALIKLLGADPVKQPGSLTVALQENPAAVVLFDEIEKASEQVRNLMLQILDEGRLTTNFGKVLDFTNTIIIATSNAGSEYIKQKVESGVNPASIEKQLLDELINRRVFLVEYLNRFDGVVVYLPLSLAEVKQVVELQLAELRRQIEQEKGLTLELSPAVVTSLAKLGYDPVFGARALSRTIKNDLETVIAREIVAQNPVPGSKLSITNLK